MPVMTTFASDGEIISEPQQPVPDDAAPVDADVADDSPVPSSEPVDAVIVADAPDEPDAFVVDAEVEVEAEVVTDLAVVDDDEEGSKKWEHTDEWKYDWLEYYGDRLAFRVPQKNQLMSLGQAGLVSEEFQLEMTNKFVKIHLSTQSIKRVVERMSDPEDADYSAVESAGGVWSDLFGKITDIGWKRVSKDLEALAAVQKKGK